jgi:hypothetical protein
MEIFFWVIFSPFFEIYFLREYFITKRNFEKQNLPKRKMIKISPIFATITFNMKRCLRFSHFHIFNVFKLTKYTYGWSSLVQHHKIGEENKKRKKTLVGQGLCQFSFSFHQVQGVNYKKNIKTLQLSIYLSN